MSAYPITTLSNTHSMSFEFSVGNLISAANLTYRLITAQREKHDVSE